MSQSILLTTLSNQTDKGEKKSKWNIHSFDGVLESLLLLLLITHGAKFLWGIGDIESGGEMWNMGHAHRTLDNPPI